ncbi:SSI family serine proteinase inhibitor [Nocardia vinacea]|uniref:SSI family serine proteinase inhibitor n=1 Tax=Nocardia vinacea TaxID=96468 RepID=UPI0002D826F9|nr:SSI family serine proteinase inhibitor [Nocardia vinacea]
MTSRAGTDTPNPAAPGASAPALVAISRADKPDVRVATLVRSSKTGGSHPEAEKSCGELATANGDFAKLTGIPGAACPMVYQPVTFLAIGMWDGKPVAFTSEFSNWCVMENAAQFVYNF